MLLPATLFIYLHNMLGWSAAAAETRTKEALNDLRPNQPDAPSRHFCMCQLRRFWSYLDASARTLNQLGWFVSLSASKIFQPWCMCTASIYLCMLPFPKMVDSTEKMRECRWLIKLASRCCCGLLLLCAPTDLPSFPLINKVGHRWVRLKIFGCSWLKMLSGVIPSPPCRSGASLQIVW